MAADIGFLPWLVGAIVVGGAISAALAGMQGESLAQKFAALGTLTGRSRQEIIDAVGPPNSVSAVGAGQTLLQWQVQGYHIALLFTGDRCDGVTHEFKHSG
ncbi:hypothetical protein ACFJIW_17405 [Tahibacter sp. UC22_41]|uniref:hypothetical protein n=1 Tax=Tahibacter sp. UC22_41 TaxID=3350178 RepID=UPI0036DD94B4